MNIFGKKINNAEEAKALYAKAKELDAAGKFEEALVAYKECEKSFHDLGNADGELTSLMGQYNINLRLKQGDKAKNNLEKAYDTATKHGMTQYVVMLKNLRDL